MVQVIAHHITSLSVIDGLSLSATVEAKLILKRRDEHFKSLVYIFFLVLYCCTTAAHDQFKNQRQDIKLIFLQT